MVLQRSPFVSGNGWGDGGSIVRGLWVCVCFRVVFYGCKFGMMYLWPGFAGFLGGWLYGF